MAHTCRVCSPKIIVFIYPWEKEEQEKECPVKIKGRSKNSYKLGRGHRDTKGWKSLKRALKQWARHQRRGK